MDELWPTLVPALSSLLGVIIGFWLQRLQRRWALQDLRRQWRKERLETQVDSILNLVGQSLAHMRLIAEGLRQGRTDLHRHAALGSDTFIAANIASITIRDTELAKLFFEYASIVRRIRDLYEQGQLTEQKIQELLEKAQVAAQKVGERAETLIAEV